MKELKQICSEISTKNLLKIIGNNMFYTLKPRKYRRRHYKDPNQLQFQWCFWSKFLPDSSASQDEILSAYLSRRFSSEFISNFYRSPSAVCSVFIYYQVIAAILNIFYLCIHINIFFRRGYSIKCVFSPQN